MWTSIPEVFPFFKRGRSQSQDGLETPAQSSPRRNPNSRTLTRTPPTLQVSMDKVAYRPGDVVVATIDVGIDVRATSKLDASESGRSIADAVLMEDLRVEVKGIERVDPQWLATPRLPPGAKQRRGERTILETSSTSVISNVLIGLGESKTYMVRTMLPKVLPPSYKGTAVRYVYYMTVSIQWTYSIVENGHGPSPQPHMAPVVSSAVPEVFPVDSLFQSVLKMSEEKVACLAISSPHPQLVKCSRCSFCKELRTPFQVWTLSNSSGLTADELHSKDHYGFSGIVPPSSIKIEIQWREKDEYSYWAQAADVPDSQLDDDKVSRRSESSTSSPVKASFEQSFERSLLLSSPGGSFKENVATTSLRKALSHSALPAAFLSEKQVAHDDILSRSFDKRVGSWEGASEDSGSFQAVAMGSNGQLSSYQNGIDSGYGGAREEERGISPPSSPSMKYMRGKTYNIRINDQILVRFGPRNPESVYYYGDTVSGTLSFLREEGARRCLEVSAFLETREILNPSYIHPSRKNSSMISKVQSEYFETVCDMIQSHFIFSIPMDGPPSFSTPLISVQWTLRFEFVTSPPKVDWSKYAHPLLIEEREKGEWSLPIIVHAPLPSRARKERPVSPKKEDLSEMNRVSFSSSRDDGSPSTLRDKASSSSSS